ncbi:MAG: hypothetical protein H2054_01120 [Sphingomonas sp.]|uniref:hypothetical protein n=1 Tax=Sphingomonas sp. TaxID=28214 RepID=UPI0018542710|nr:hypothetical protein [Sphingomonas sp.]
MTRSPHAALILFALAALAGCGSAPDPESRAALADMNAAMVANATDMPMPMPDGEMANMAKFALYPGSKLVEAAKIMPHEPADMTSFSFWSPAAPATLRGWYQTELSKAGYKLRVDGDSLIGTDKGGKPFRLDLMAAPGGAAMGVVSQG